MDVNGEATLGVIAPVTVAETGRLRLRHLSNGDAAFMLELLNDPDYIQNIGDRGVRNLEDAERYILTGPAESYKQFGFGLYLVELRQPVQSIGICGLLRRDYHPDVEIGFAFLPGGRGHGYVFEAATAVLEVARSLKLDRIVAITALDNQRSIRVLEKLGFRFEGTTTFGGQTGARKLFVREPANSQDALG